VRYVARPVKGLVAGVVVEVVDVTGVEDVEEVVVEVGTAVVVVEEFVEIFMQILF
jgi:hypothetical protein